MVSRDRLIHLPYQLIRRPLAVIDDYAVKKLPTGNLVRELYHAGLRFADQVGGVDRSGSPAGREPAQDDPEGSSVRGGKGASPETPSRDAAREQAEEQRHQEFSAKIDEVTRSNHSPAKMARELAQVRAAEQARDHDGDRQATQGTDAPDDE